MTSPPPSPASQTDLESRVVGYLAALDRGEEPSTADFADGLSGRDQEVLTALLSDTLRARQELPAVSGSSDIAHSCNEVIGGRYELETELGKGGFGSVWRARDRNLGRPVAIKFVTSQPGGGDEGHQRFRDEVHALVRSRFCGFHVYDVGYAEGSAYLVLEMIEGRSMSRVIEDLRARGSVGSVPLPSELRTALRVLRQPGDEDLLREDDWFRTCARICIAVLRAAEAIHACGVRHRDIKPSNIILRGGGNPVLVDFGLAAEHDRRLAFGATEGLSGSLPYLAPEQIENRRTGIDVRTDVYQIGLLLYEFCTLQRAFSETGSEKGVTKIRESDFKSPRSICPAIPPDLERICLRAMQREPELRYQTAASFRVDLERWLGGMVPPVALQGPGIRLRLARSAYWARRHMSVLLVLAGIGIGLGAAGIVRAMG